MLLQLVQRDITEYFPPRTFRNMIERLAFFPIAEFCRFVAGRGGVARSLVIRADRQYARIGRTKREQSHYGYPGRNARRYLGPQG